MADLIDRQAFIEDIKTEIMNLYLDGMKGTPRPRGELYDLIDRINEQPAVNAVEVVRCCNCRNLYDGDDGYCCKLHVGMVKITPYSFCSYGERKEKG